MIMYILGQEGCCVINTDNISHIYINDLNFIMAKPIDGLPLKIGGYKDFVDASAAFKMLVRNTVPHHELFEMPTVDFNNVGCPFDEMG